MQGILACVSFHPAGRRQLQPVLYRDAKPSRVPKAKINCLFNSHSLSGEKAAIVPLKHMSMSRTPTEGMRRRWNLSRRSVWLACRGLDEWTWRLAEAWHDRWR